MNGRYHYGLRSEWLEHYGVRYEAFGVVAKNGENVNVIVTDATRSKDAIMRLCNLLNDNELEPEQARYVIEDFVAEQYLAI